MDTLLLCSTTAAGITPGERYPVFDTRFGKLGLMICWDVHFPEVARNLSNHGAEVIAMPIWGGNPALARARKADGLPGVARRTRADDRALSYLAGCRVVVMGEVKTRALWRATVFVR